MLQPIGLKNIGVDCWMNALFQCLNWNDSYREMLITYLPDHTNEFDGKLWKASFAIYQKYSKAVNQVETKFVNKIFPPQMISSRRLAKTLFPNSQLSRQEDVSDVLIKLFEFLPDREKKFCKEHAPINTHPLVIYRSRLSDPIIKYCQECKKEEKNIIATHGYDCQKEISGRFVNFLEQDHSIPSTPLPTNHNRTRVGISLGKEPRLFFTSDGGQIVQIMLPMPTNSTSKLVSCNDLLENYVYISLPKELQYSWKGADPNNQLTSYQVVGFRRELNLNPITQKPPASLILSFNRFQSIPGSYQPIKISIEVDIRFQMNFESLFFEDPLGHKEACSKQDFCYDLASFIVHQGKMANRGHYVAYVCVDLKDKKWFLCDDDTISPVNLSQVKLASKEAYVCFFSRSII